MPTKISSIKIKLLVLLSCSFISGTAFASSNIEGIQLYQKNLHLYPEHKQKLAEDISRYRHADIFWNVLRDEFALPHYEDNPAVQEKIDWFMNNQEFLIRSTLRAAPYLYYIAQQVRKRHLPAELVLLPIVESGYNPFAISNVGATGIWQMMPGTASGLGIKRNSIYDGRRDVIASTRGALNYLAYLQSFFDGNWLYAIAAYNTGEGNVLSAIRRNIRDGKATDFWSLPVAQQTKDYVPSLLALAIIISHPERYPIYFPPVRNAPYLGQVEVGRQIDLKYAALLAGISEQRMIQLNPGFGKSSTQTTSAYKLVLPIENVEKFSENFARSPINRDVNWIRYKVKTGDTLASIARKFSTTPAQISQLNHLTKNTVSRGLNLVIPSNDFSTTRDEDIQLAQGETELQTKSERAIVMSDNVRTKSERYASTINISQAAQGYTLQPGDTVYMVRSSDTIEGVAKHFRVNVQTIQIANRLKDKKLTPGKQLIIPTHPLTAQADSSELQPGDTIYMVRRGDTIESIADRFNTTPAAIRLTNLLSGDEVQTGDRLVIPTHLQG